MNKTITITLGGQIFHIEEDAYKQLSEYLDSIKTHLGDDRNEIMQDIEASIADKFSNLINDKKPVVNKKDVDDLIKVMGTVEDFTESGHSNGKEQSKSAKDDSKNAKQAKKLYRDPDDVVIAGVCSGLGAYLGLDPVIVRVLFAITVFFGGAGVLMYIILWVAMPLATTSTQKLEMQGDPVTLNKLQEIAKEKIEAAKAGTNTNFFRTLMSIPVKIINVLIVIIKKFFPVIGIIIGSLVVLGCLFAIGFLSFFASLLIFTPNSPYIFSDFPINEVIQGMQYYAIILSTYFVAIIPIIFVMIVGIIMVKRKNIFTIAVSLILVTFWMIAIITTGVIGVSVAPRIEEKVNQIDKNIKLINKDFSLNDFREVEINGNYTLNIIKSDKFKISTTGREQDIKQLNMYVNNNRIYIRQKHETGVWLFRYPKPIEINIAMPELVDYGSDGMVKASIKGFTSDSFKAYIDGLSKLNLVTNTKQMELNIDGSSNVSYTGSTSRLTVKLDGVSTFSSSGLNLSNLELDLDGMSKAELTGRSEMVNAEVFGSSKLLAYNLIADQIDIDLDGASRAEVNASKILNIKSDGVSKIYYKGDPQITKNIGGLSDAENIQLEESDLQDTGDGKSFIVNKLSTTSNDNVIQVK